MASAKIISANGIVYLDPNDGTGGRWAQADNEPGRGTYSLFMPAVTTDPNPTDILVIKAGSKIVRLRSIIVTGTATAASNIQMYLYRRSTSNAGGTSVAQTPVQRDVNDDAKTASLSLYSANPTSLGTSLGVMDGGRLNLAPAANGSIDRLILQYGWMNDKAPVVRSATQFLCLGMNGAAMPAGGTIDISITWSEE